MRSTPAFWSLALLLLGLLSTAAMAHLDWRQQQQRAESLQHSLANAAQSRMQDSLKGGAMVLRSMQTVFLSSAKMDQHEFAQYQQNLRPQELARGYVLTGYARRQPDPAHPAQVAYRYQFVAPLEGNQVLLGFDITRQPENLRALQVARDRDLPTASAPFPLLQFKGQPASALGITLRLPVYSPGAMPVTVTERRARELGALAVSMRLGPMITQALQGRVLDYMHVHIRDLDAPAGQDLVFASAPPVADIPQQVRHLDFGGRRWEMRLWPRTGIVEWGQLRAILGGGTTISILLALLLWSQMTTRRRAVDLGRRMSVRFGESEARFRTLNELLPALVLLTNGDGSRITYANQTARQLLGTVVGAPLCSLFADSLACERAMAMAASGSGWRSQEAMLAPAAGAAFWINASLAQVEVEGLPHLLMVATDTSAQRAMTERLHYQATHDELTGLRNRREFERLLREALAGYGCTAPVAPFALLYFDLDQFKLINDLSGHAAGDQLLVQLVRAMRAELGHTEFLARLGGDEFGVLAFGVDLARAEALAERIRRCIEGHIFHWQERTYTVSASIGLVMVEGEGSTLKDLLAWADSACYQAKENGRNRVCTYREDAASTQRIGEMEWANRLRGALEHGQLLLDYQQLVALDPTAGDAVHVELLLRMRDHTGRVVMPGAFLSAGERYGLMPAVDRWVIHTALANFQQIHPCGAQLHSCSINLSGASLEDDGLADFILDTISTFGVPAQRLCFEITETVAVRDLQRVARVIERLRAAGCRIALDDFGAGMSSFGYLKNLPVDAIKIDGSFVRDLEREPVSRIIIDAVTRIGHERRLQVVAEWVDEQGVLEVLRELGVDYAQGFLLHRPERVLFQREKAGVRVD
ncbi:EAL domain-containing protein [Stenotrophomonas sp. YIM B06876]|uniref:bifunctional diguanylate cyclase/phosphodiesterase n=1 Tax=Stenotrophomonas sp. YIM B06876 TaxID=3060211 RepID=UPI002738A4A7|nr:EAL domain-containing protein [Stenotrophomonas sp. YIM B06876]